MHKQGKEVNVSSVVTLQEHKQGKEVKVSSVAGEGS